jgi:hypothetical protein
MRKGEQMTGREDDRKTTGERTGSHGPSTSHKSGDATPTHGWASKGDWRHSDNGAKPTRDDHPGPDTPVVGKPWKIQPCDY